MREDKNELKRSKVTKGGEKNYDGNGREAEMRQK